MIVNRIIFAFTVGISLVGLECIQPCAIAEDPSKLEYSLEHAFSTGQLLVASIRRETLLYDPRAETTVTHDVTTNTVIKIAVPTEAETKGLDVEFTSIHVASNLGDGRRIYIAGEKEDADGGYDLLIGRHFLFSVQPDRGIELATGVDDYVNLLQRGGHTLGRPKFKTKWKHALEQMLHQPNAYFPSESMAVGDEWEITRSLEIIPMGYPLLHGISSGKSTERVTARLMSVENNKEGHVASIDISGVLSGIEVFDISGDIRLNLDQKILLDMSIVLSKRGASPAKCSPNSRFVVELRSKQGNDQGLTRQHGTGAV